MFHDSIHCCVRTCANRTSLVIYEYVDIFIFLSFVFEFVLYLFDSNIGTYLVSIQCYDILRPLYMYECNI